MLPRKWLIPLVGFCVAGCIAGGMVAQTRSGRDAKTEGGASTANRITAPVLKWKYAGCYSSWCETGWYSSQAVADLDGNGTPEVIASAYSVVALEGASGEVLWRVASGHDRSQPPCPETPNVGRTWPGIVVADVDGDGKPEIVSAHGGGWVSVYDETGYFEPGWPQRPGNSELRGLLVDDLDGDGTMEIVVNEAENYKNTWVYEHDGALRPGWPRLQPNDDGGYGGGGLQRQCGGG